ncbi:MAG: zinc ribbon domain-containing protein [Clostridia bacterium]|nr:zinc ribbon domain-containing protein [Clostridia bacterium]
MFCPNCGNKLEDGAAVCPACGTPRYRKADPPQTTPASPQQPTYQQAPPQPVYQQAPPQPTYQQTPQQQPVYQQAPQQPVYQQTPPQPAYQQMPPQPTYQQMPPQQPMYPPMPQQPGAGAFYGAPVPPAGKAPKQKKKKKWIAPVAILLVVAVIASVVAFAFPTLQNVYMKTFATPVQYYRHVGERSAKELGRSIGAIYNTNFYDTVAVKGGKDEIDVDVAVSEDMRSLIASSTGADLSWLKELGLSLSVSSREGDAVGAFALKVNGTELLSGDFGASDTDSGLFVKLRDFSEEYARLDLSDLSDGNAAFFNSLLGAYELREKMPDGKTVEDLIARYAGVLLAVLDEDDVTKESGALAEAGVEEKGTWLRAEIRGEDAKTMAAAFVHEARDDEDLLRVVNQIKTLTGEEPFSGEAWNGKLDELMDTTMESEGEGSVILSAFVAENGEVHGRRIEADGSTLIYAFPQNNGSFGYRLEVQKNGATGITLTGSGKKSGDAITGDFAVSGEGEEAFSFRTEGFDWKKFKEGVVKGKFIFGGEGEIADDLAAGLFSNMIVTVDADISAKGGSARIVLSDGESDQLTVTVSAKTGSAGAVDPVTTGKEMSEWLSSLDEDHVMETLREKMRRAGIPQELIEDVFD